MIGNETGKLGEDIAEMHLKGAGYKIIHKNYWKPYGEIDIVCEREGTVHFVEVKSVSCEMSNSSHVPGSSYEVGRSVENIRPEDNIHKSKLHKLANVIQSYISTFHVKDWQFDVVIVYIDKGSRKARVKVIENQVLEGRG
jgi:putative endonuclease